MGVAMQKWSQETAEIRLIKVCPLCHRKFHTLTPANKCPEDMSALTPMTAPSTGKTVASRYQLQSPISRNKWSEVFFAKDIFSARDTVVKVIQLSLESDPSRASRFRREAEAAKRLRHARIVKTSDYGITNDGRPFLVMEIAQGENLKQALQRNRFTPLVCARLMMQLADALGYAHRRGIIHGDIKPANVMVADPKGDFPRATVLDFGVAKTLATEAMAGQPEMHQIMVTPAYISPEQYLGGQASQASDIYSLGCVFYEMLSGEPLVSSSNAIDCMNWHLHRRVPPLTVPGKDAAELEKIVRYMLERSDADRYSNMGQVKADLQRFFNKKAIKGPCTVNQRTKRKRSLSGPKLIILIVAALLAILASLMYADRAKKRKTLFTSSAIQSLCIKPENQGEQKFLHAN